MTEPAEEWASALKSLREYIRELESDCGTWPPAQHFQEAIRQVLQEYDVSLTFRDGVWVFRSTDLFITVTIEELASYLGRPRP